jgi:hypothetical protein
MTPEGGTQIEIRHPWRGQDLSPKAAEAWRIDEVWQPTCKANLDEWGLLLCPEHHGVAAIAKREDRYRPEAS